MPQGKAANGTREGMKQHGYDPRRPVIIGAGIAGLTAALHLAEASPPQSPPKGGRGRALEAVAPDDPQSPPGEGRKGNSHGLRPLVLEADPVYPGGRLKGSAAITFVHQGQTWRFRGEHGVHAIWSPYRNFQAMLARHRIRPVLVPAREEAWLHNTSTRVRRAAIGSAIRSSWIPAPLHYLGLFARPRFLAMLSVRDFASMFRVIMGLFAALSIDPLVEDRALPGFTLAEYCDKWSPTLISLFTGLTRNAIPAPLAEIPAAGFIAFLRFYTLRRRDAWAFSYLPDEGPASIVAPLVDKVLEHGGSLRLGAKVTHLTRHQGRWRVVWEDETASRHVVETDHVILATDAPGTEALLQASPDTAEYAANLHLPIGTPTAIVRIWFDRQPPKPMALQFAKGLPTEAQAGVFTGDFILDNFFWLDRIYNDYITWRRATGGSAIESHIYGPPGLLARPDAALLAQAIVEIGEAWPELKRHIVHTTLTRNDATHTLLDVGRPGEHLAVTTPWPNLFCCGDWVRDPNPALFLERACVTGIKAANAVLAQYATPQWPILEHLGPEPLARFIEHTMRGARLALLRRRQDDPAP